MAKAKTPARAKVAKSAKPAAAKRGVTHRILVVEDDPVLLFTLSSKLRRLGYEVSEAKDGLEADASVKTAVPCMVFLDILLPRKSGFDFLEGLRAEERTKDVPVVVLSQFGEEDFLTKAKNLGVVKYMVKANHSLAEVSELTRTITERCKNHAKAKA